MTDYYGTMIRTSPDESIYWLVNLSADVIGTDGAGECPVVTSITVISLNPTVIRVTFSDPVKYNSALVQPGNYVIVPSLTVHSVTPEEVTNPTYVDLETDEQNTGTTYEIEVQGVEKV